MKKWWMKGITLMCCLALMAPVGVSATQDPKNMAEQNKTDQELLDEAKVDAQKALNDYLIFLEPDEKELEELQKLINEAMAKIGSMSTPAGVTEYVTKVKASMLNVTNPPADEDEDEEEEEVPVNADHFLMVGGSWVTPVATAGEQVSIVLPVVNMGKTMVTDAVVTPVLSTDTTAWPFEITNSNYSQTIKDLPGTDTGASDMDRRRELTWNLKTRSDVGNGYQKISFDVRYRDSQGVKLPIWIAAGS